MTRRVADRRSRRLLLAVGACSLAVALLLALVVTKAGPFADDPPRTAVSVALPADRSALTPRHFLDRYVLADGRVVRRDQGGDTVSEGQAYAMLIAVAAGDRSAFERVWDWSRQHLHRDDGLLSWHWQNGSVVDATSAADADLDTARALVVAGRVFDEAAWTRAGVRLGTAILDHETVVTPLGRILVAGSWATSAPYAFNPSYVSPAATRLLSRASGDDRWAELEKGSRAALTAATPEDHLPPDWAQVDQDGSVHATSSPSGGSVVFGYDAARTLVRNAESCTAGDRALARRTSDLLAGADTKAVYDLGGSPQTQDVSPLTLVAAAAGDAVAGSRAATARLLADADRARQRTPTYYGDAWSVLGRLMLTDRTLGGCPPLAPKES
ncbi:glycoside hydrolase [Nocardioides mangrovicus]|uniref:Glycoside hydrolase n=1 Tax=Nocardioides mangrovicus TaxID=2478913 RepID=A0A3L8P1Q8_9ACTN|nr:glycosyl hydrolase family 8 [Nocardioides mangrovicus]RLV49094.1 glycoside hydrolase [Nocardioides mangrovicus]